MELKSKPGSKTPENQPDGPTTNINQYSRLNRLGRGGRLNASSMYVDVMNTGSKGPPLGSAPPPPLLPPMGPMQFNPANIFVPQPGM